MTRVRALRQWQFQDVPKLDAIADFTNSPRGPPWGTSRDDVGPDSCEASSDVLDFFGRSVVLVGGSCLEVV